MANSFSRKGQTLVLHGPLPERTVPFSVSDGGRLPNGPELIVLLVCFWQHFTSYTSPSP